MMHCLKPIIANKRGVSAKSKRATNLRNKKTRKKSTTSVSKLRLIATVIIVILFSLGLYTLNQLESEKITRANKPAKNTVITEEKSLPSAEDDYTFYCVN